MKITFDARISKDRQSVLTRNACDTFYKRKEEQAKKNKELYKFRCAIGFHNGDTLAPFVVMDWHHDKPQHIHISVCDK